jgi:DNA-binding response OmpR family regulator
MRSPLVLLVEDEALIALAVTDDLETAGYAVAGPFHRSSDTLAWLREQSPDVAIINIHLRDGSSAELARVLRERDVPFVVYSGDRLDGRSPDAFAGARWLSKPAGARQLIDTLGELAEGRVPGRPSATAAAAAQACPA